MRPVSAVRAWFGFALLACAAACGDGGPFTGLAPAKKTGGPTVQFALTGEPEALPYPNDLLARLDGESPTGLRVNLPIRGDTRTAQLARAQLDLLDGFSTNGPITVSFDQDLDLLDLYARQNDSDPGNDGVYLVDLTTGAPVALDFNSGRFPLELPVLQSYFLDDPLAGDSNLLFSTEGLSPNYLHSNEPFWATTHGGIPQQSDDLLTFYERATHTLILRPVFPLEQERTYAVLLTDRLLGSNGRAVQSPLSGINHAMQTHELSALLGVLPQGTRLDDLAFAWAFTTQTTTKDLEAIEEGLGGSGILRPISLRFPVLDSSVVGTGESTIRLLPEQDLSGAGAYVMKAATLVTALRDPRLEGILTPADAQARAALFESLGYIDYFISGTYPSLDLLVDPDRPHDESAFALDVASAFIRADFTLVPFLIAVPKHDEAHGHSQPFPTVLAAHDLGGSRLDPMLSVAGTFAQQGLATAAIDGPGQGLQLDPGSEAIVRAVFADHSVEPFLDALLASRARDLDGDGVVDPGGDLFSVNPFHTRDLLRQTAVDCFQLSRLLRSFTGNALMNIPSNNALATAGDFDGDGIPDLGGPAVWPADVTDLLGNILIHRGTVNPGADQFAYGVGLGGAVAAIVAAVEPGVVAAAPVSAPGNLSETILRTHDPRIQDGAFLTAFGPILAISQSQLFWDASIAGREVHVPIAPLTLRAGDRVTACNLSRAPGAVPPDSILAANPPAYCTTALAGANGQVRLPLAAEGPFAFQIESPLDAGVPAQVQTELIRDGDRVRVFVSPAAGGGLQTIDSFQYPVIADGISRSPGEALRAISGGYGRDRNTPAFRELAGSWQALFDPGDPINYAPLWNREPAAGRNGVPPNVLLIATLGDSLIPTAQQIALARAAGFVETTVPDPNYGVPIDQVLKESAAIEGVARLPRFASPEAGPGNALGAHLICAPQNDCTAPVVADVSGLACLGGLACTDGLAAPRLSPPLQQQLWRTTRDASGNAVGTSALELADFSRTGGHGLTGPRPAQPFDLNRFLGNQIARYFETRGAELHLEPCQALASSCPWNSYPPPY